jgi:hypothetical protein
MDAGGGFFADAFPVADDGAPEGGTLFVETFEKILDDILLV